MDVIAFLGLILLDVSLPFAIVSLCLSRKIQGAKKAASLFFPFICFGLAIGALVCGILGLAFSGTTCSSFGSNSIYCYYYRSPTAWVSFGLSLGSIVIGILSLVLVLIFRNNLFNNSKPEKESDKSNSTERQTSSFKGDYIEEIKRLKELLDCGAINQEEFDTKKKKLLS